MVLTLHERIFLIENVLRNNGKYSKETRNSFKERFGADRLPDRNCVYALLSKFKNTGSVLNKQRWDRGQPKVITDSVLMDIGNRLQAYPKKSLRRLWQETQTSLTTCYRAVHQLKCHPYKVQAVQELKIQDTEARVEYCRWFEEFILENSQNILDYTFF